jgi:hypothetical protein
MVNPKILTSMGFDLRSNCYVDGATGRREKLVRQAVLYNRNRRNRIFLISRTGTVTVTC